jgi:hypothetical protein
MSKHRLQSLPGEITRENYMKINNTEYDAEHVALMIKERFQL